MYDLWSNVAFNCITTTHYPFIKASIGASGGEINYVLGLMKQQRVAAQGKSGRGNRICAATPN